MASFDEYRYGISDGFIEQIENTESFLLGMYRDKPKYISDRMDRLEKQKQELYDKFEEESLIIMIKIRTLSMLLNSLKGDD